MTAPRKGLRFRHARVVNWDADKTPALYEVTRVAQGTVYYRNVIDAGIAGSERLGGAERCPLDWWERVCLAPEVPDFTTIPMALVAKAAGAK